MSAALRSELRKVLTTQMWWILALVMAGYMAFLGAVMAFSLTVEVSPEQGGMEPMDPQAVAEAIYTLAPTLGYVFPLIMGALAVTGELRHKTITPTFLGEPRRSLVLVAKLVVQAGFGAFLGVVGTGAAVATGAAVLAVQGEPTMLGESSIWANLAWSVVALALWGVIGVGVGALIPNQIASVVVILAFTQFVEPILRMGLGAVDALSAVSKFLPGAAAEALVGASLYATSGLAELLGRVEGGLVLLAYAIVLAGIGRLTTFRRDVT